MSIDHLRSSCVITGRNDLEVIRTFKNFPVFMGTTDSDKTDDVCSDLIFSISDSSACLQLGRLVDQDLVYIREHGAGSVGDLWRQHHLELGTFLNKHVIGDVIEIGGGHGILSKNCLDNGFLGKWTIYEPNPQCEIDNRIELKQEFFTSESKISNDQKTIVHSHLLEHMYEPREFLETIARQSNKGDRMIVSVPNMTEMLKSGYLNTLNFEHTYYAGYEYLEILFNHYGFSIVKQELFKDDHSIFYALDFNCKKEYDDEILVSENLKSRNITIYNNYFNKIQNSVESILNKITMDKDVFVFGAHVFTQYLICMGLDESRVNCILDNDRKKHGLRLYGSELYVASPNILAEKKNPVVITSGTGVYRKEIESQCLDINKGCILI